MTVQNQVPVVELRRLLYEIRDHRLDIGVRFRLIGEMWQPAFLHVLLVTEKGMALQDTVSKKLLMVADLTQVMQFELDQPFQQYQSHFHYSVDPALVET